MTTKTQQVDELNSLHSDTLVKINNCNDELQLGNRLSKSHLAALEDKKTKLTKILDDLGAQISKLT